MARHSIPKFAPFPAARLAAAPYGHSIRSDKGYPAPVDNHFLLYIREVSGGAIDARQMWDYGISDIAESEKKLFHLAKGPYSTPYYIGPEFFDMLWQFPSYFTIVLDNDNFKFNFSSNLADDDGEPIIFIPRRFKVDYHPNYSFYNAKPVDVPILDAQENPTGAVRHGLRFENHVKADDIGTPLAKGDWRRFKMDLAIWKPSATVGGQNVLTFTDPDGQNQGPTGVP
ncbi:MAG: hypothetical protein QOD42_2872 [Sphingomonadales bacterium]|jgi:hypothetical protein|nr:hypothetical protein [Sphingomonadales bacterium]